MGKSQYEISQQEAYAFLAENIPSELATPVRLVLSCINKLVNNLVLLLHDDEKRDKVSVPRHLGL